MREFVWSRMAAIIELVYLKTGKSGFCLGLMQV
jgi:hypothetical protein